MKETLDMRYVEVRGVRYLRSDDVAQYIRTIGETEETDVQNRLNQAATHINKS